VGAPESNANTNGYGSRRMASGRVLITGGAGFVGSHPADELLEHGYQVRVLDNLNEQVHGTSIARPSYLDPDVELIRGDVRSARTVDHALQGVDAVFHFAAAVGLGQSMYEVERYVDVNTRRTAVLLESAIRARIGRLVVASSMSVYGEGLSRTASGQEVSPPPRSFEHLRKGQWELLREGAPLMPLPTPETKVLSPSSVYALSKYDQEKLCLVVGAAYGIPTVALRFFNVYGTRQARSNPYTGVLAIFAVRYLNRRPPPIFEDGRQQRDFVHVCDVARACRLALNAEEAGGYVVNIGSGRPRSVLDIAPAMAEALGVDDIAPTVTGKFGVGDIRHGFADVELAKRQLGCGAQINLSEGLAERVRWLAGENAFDQVESAAEELARRGSSL